MSKLNINDIKFIAYHSNNSYPNKYKETGNAIPFKEGHITGYSLNFKRIMYIFIAGTDEAKDIITDIRLIPSHLDGAESGVKVHRGFESAFKRIDTLITKLCAGQSRVIIAGHSMGGAIATLVAYKMIKLIPDVTCVTFGSPRVGNRKFIKNFNERVTDSYRLVYRNDAVTKVPKLLFWYRHVGKLYKSRDRRWFSLFIFFSLTDHPMGNYIDGLKKDMWKF